MRVRQFMVAAGLMLIVGCAARHGAPVIDTGSRPPGVGGTVSGTVRTSGGTSLTARKVTVIETTSGARLESSTATNGGYTIKVPAGTYRIEVELRPGETLAEQPDTTEVNVGDLDAGLNFVITAR